MSLGLVSLPPSRRHSGLGMRRVGIAFVLLVAVQFASELAKSIAQWPEYERPLLVVTAWGVLLASQVSVVIVTKALGEHLPNWMLALFLGGLSVSLALDISATWSTGDLGGHLTVGIAAVGGTMLACTTRRGSELLAAASIGTGATILAMGASGSLRPDLLYAQIPTLCEMLLPTVVAVSIVAGLRSFLQIELERVLSQSAIAAPRVVLGPMSSERLAAVDLEAEQLLAAVGDGRVPLPLPAEEAGRAADLAAELRLNLLRTRAQTWLDLATAESELLRASVSITDRFHAAGLLANRQRAGLLAAIWLLLERRGRADAIDVEFGPHQASAEGPQSAEIPIRVSIPGATRAAVDAATWEYFAQVGRYLETTDAHGFHVDIRATVNPSVAVSS